MPQNPRAIDGQPATRHRRGRFQSRPCKQKSTYGQHTVNIRSTNRPTTNQPTGKGTWRHHPCTTLQIPLILVARLLSVATLACPWHPSPKPDKRDWRVNKYCFVLYFRKSSYLSPSESVGGGAVRGIINTFATRSVCEDRWRPSRPCGESSRRPCERSGAAFLSSERIQQNNI